MVDAGLIAVRAARAVLVKNVVGSVAKLAALAALAAAGVFGISGSAISYSVGAGLAAAMGAAALWRRLRPDGETAGPLRVLRRYLSFSYGSYAGTVIGILPATVVPLMVLAARGPVETAYFAVAFMLASFLNFVPSTTAQVLMAEVSRGERTLRAVAGKALRHVYALLLPAVLLLALAAPLVLRLFGDDYAQGASTCLQAWPSARWRQDAPIWYSILAARDRMRAYVLMNAVNAALVLGLVGVMLPYGLAAVGAAWALAQTASALVGFVVLRASGVWRSSAAPPAGPPAAAAAAEAETHVVGRL